MVNVLEALYVVTSLSALAFVIALVRRRPRDARRFGIVAGSCSLIAAGLYWYL